MTRPEKLSLFSILLMALCLSACQFLAEVPSKAQLSALSDDDVVWPNLIATRPSMTPIRQINCLRLSALLADTGVCANQKTPLGLSMRCPLKGKAIELKISCPSQGLESAIPLLKLSFDENAEASSLIQKLGGCKLQSAPNLLAFLANHPKEKQFCLFDNDYTRLQSLGKETVPSGMYLEFARPNKPEAPFKGPFWLYIDGRLLDDKERDLALDDFYRVFSYIYHGESP